MINDPTYRVPPAAGEWVDRMEAACRVIEERFGVELKRAHTGTKNNATTTMIKDRPKYFRRRLKTKNRWFSLFSGTGLKRTENGFKNEDYFLVGGNMYYGEQSYHLSTILPDDQSPKTQEEVLCKLGDAVGADSSQFMPKDVAWRLRLAHWCVVFPSKVHSYTLPDKTSEEATLPAICESLYAGLTPLQPHHLGWLNYWSQEVCRHVGFPENVTGTVVADCSYQTPRGAWIVKLGADPFEQKNARQVELLRDMYERFPRVGIRLEG